MVRLVVDEDVDSFLTASPQWTYDATSRVLTPQWINTDGCMFSVLVAIDGCSYVFVQLPPTRNSSPTMVYPTLVVIKMHSLSSSGLLPPS